MCFNDTDGLNYQTEWLLLTSLQNFILHIVFVCLLVHVVCYIFSWCIIIYFYRYNINLFSDYCYVRTNIREIEDLCFNMGKTFLVFIFGNSNWDIFFLWYSVFKHYCHIYCTLRQQRLNTFFIFLSLQFSNIKMFLSHFSQELWGLEGWNIIPMRTVGEWIVYTESFHNIFLQNCKAKKVKTIQSNKHEE